jgi:DNA-binding transcriptional MerR regulator
MQEDIAQIQSLSATPRYNIKAVVRQTQINISTLRAWEQRYGMPHPIRSDHGHRLYSARDVATIKWLKQCTERGVNISQAVALLREHQTTTTPHPEPQDDYNALPISAGISRLLDNLVDALNNVNLHRAHLLTNTACALFPLETVIYEMLYPLQRLMSERWGAGEICVAEERMVSNFVRQRLQTLMQIHEPFAHGPRLICACAPHEQHEIGLMMFTLLLELRGWQAVYLGQNLAVEGFADFAKRSAPALIYFNVTMIEHINGLFDLCQAVANLNDQRIVLAYGGRVFETHPELRERLPGIFLGNDLHEAVLHADALGEQIDFERSRIRYRPIVPTM